MGLRKTTGGLLAAMCMLTFGAAEAAAAMHTGDAWCTGEMEQSGASMAGECLLPFQGWPVGVAGVFDSEPDDPADAKAKAAEVHIELIARTAGNRSQPMGVECEEIVTGTARCELADNPLGSPVSLLESVPTEIVGLVCSGHSHAKYSRLAPPVASFACWSTDEARASLESKGWFAARGFGS